MSFLNGTNWDPTRILDPEIARAPGAPNASYHNLPLTQGVCCVVNPPSLFSASI